MTKVMYDHMDEIRKVHSSLEELTKESMATGLYIPLHPGAYKFYEEKGTLSANMKRLHKDLLGKMKQND
jgi:TRAP-type uncharacterized transport system substrate-binding protein